MDEKENKNKELISGLKSPDEKIVAETLNELRSHGNIQILPAIFELFFSKRMEVLSEEIESFLNDVKDPDAVPVFMDAIKKYRGQEKFRHLISACWQCGLDFSPYIDEFITIVIEENDYYTSVEAFSVIEENVNNLTSQQRTARLEYVRSRLEFLKPDKRMLVNELVSLLSPVSGPFRLDPDHVN